MSLQDVDEIPCLEDINFSSLHSSELEAYQQATPEEIKEEIIENGKIESLSRVLIVDDDEINLLVMSSRLTDHKISADQAFGG